MHSSIINEQMRVFICGGGIGGLSSALSLAKGLNVGHKPLITVQESLSEASILLHANKRNLGLWGPALKILRDLEIYTDDMDIHNGRKFRDKGIQIAAGVPLKCDEKEDFMTFRIGLFGLDKLYNVDAALERLNKVVQEVFN